MKKYGFTLVELLAVIVVLAIIALISVPIITGVIDKAKEGAVKNSAYGIIEAGELYYANNLSKGQNEDIEFTCSKNKCINEEKEIDYKGSIDNGILKVYSDGKITVCIEKDNYGAYKLATEKEVSTGKGTCNDDYTVDAYISKAEYDKVKNELDGLKTLLNQTDITEADVKEGKKAYSNGEIVTGVLKSTKSYSWTLSVSSLGARTATIDLSTAIPSFNIDDYKIVGGHGGLTTHLSGTTTYNHGTAVGSVSMVSYDSNTGVLTYKYVSSNIGANDSFKYSNTVLTLIPKD